MMKLSAQAAAPKAADIRQRLVMMNNISLAVKQNISAYGAEGIVVKKVMLGSWDELSQGNGREGYSIRTVDRLPYRGESSLTRNVCTLEKEDFEPSMDLLNKLANESDLVIIDNT